MKARAFTLIELLVSMIVVILVLGIGIARYVEVNTAEELRGSVSVLQECLIEANVQSRTTMAPYVWVELTGSASGGLVCTRSGYDLDDAFTYESAKPTVAASVGPMSTKQIPITICEVIIDNTPHQRALPIQMVFSGHDQGKVRKILVTPISGAPGNQVPPNTSLKSVASEGHSVDLKIALASTGCGYAKDYKTLSISKTGSPIYVQ